MRAALIVDGKVAGYIEVEEFTADWVPPGNSKVGWSWDGQKFSPPDGQGTPDSGITVPAEVPMLNAHLVLIASGKMQTLLDEIASLPTTQRQEATAYLNLARTCKRTNKWVLQLAPALGLADADIDQLFVQAGSLNP